MSMESNLMLRIKKVILRVEPFSRIIKVTFWAMYKDSNKTINQIYQLLYCWLHGKLWYRQHVGDTVAYY